MPTQPIVDAHMHLWDSAAHPWYPHLPELAAALGEPALAGNFLPADYDAATAGAAVTGLVHVSTTTARHAYLDETAWVDGLAPSLHRPVAVIGTVDPALPVPELLTHLETQSGSPRFRGIRVYRGLAPNTPAADAIASWLQDRDAVFDLVAHPGNMLDWIDFLAGYPDLRVVLEHLGLPQGTTPDHRIAWSNALSLAAKETPWLCKLSGLGLICPDLTWPTLEYWLETSVQLWGWHRLVFASNLPVDSAAGTFTDLLATIDRAVTADATDHEAELFYAATASATYALESAV